MARQFAAFDDSHTAFIGAQHSFVAGRTTIDGYLTGTGTAP